MQKITGPIVIFHGGCGGCTRQTTEDEGVDYCFKCQYFDAEWHKPNLNNRNLTLAEKTRKDIKKRMKVKRFLLGFGA